MMSADFLPIESYAKVEEIIRSIFYVERLLPEYVFQKRYLFTLLADFDYVFGKSLPNIIHNSCFCRSTDKILMSVLDPEPVAYFHKHFGKINSFCFGAGISDREYGNLRLLNPGNEVDAIQFNSETVVWIPDNGRWAIWGERSREIAVIGVDDPAQAEFLLNEDGYWIDAETAVAEFAAMPYRNQKTPEDFARPLIENYGSCKDLERKLDEAGIRLKPGIWADE